MLIKNYNYSENEISMIVADTSNYLWVGFQQDASGNCALQKVSSNDPEQVYYDINVAIDEFTKGIINSLYLYVAVDDSSLLGKRYTRSNPLGTVTDFSIPVGIIEAPIDILVSTYVYFLIPGNLSGTNTKIVKFSTAGVYQETIDLTTVTNATSFCISDVDEIWVVTNESPASYVRVFSISGGSYDYEINN